MPCVAVVGACMCLRFFNHAFTKGPAPRTTVTEAPGAQRRVLELCFRNQCCFWPRVLEFHTPLKKASGTTQNIPQNTKMLAKPLKMQVELVLLFSPRAEVRAHGRDQDHTCSLVRPPWRTCHGCSVGPPGVAKRSPLMSGMCSCCCLGSSYWRALRVLIMSLQKA